MNKNLQKFDGYKFRQAMSETRGDCGGFYGEDWELLREARLDLAANDCQRMWRHIWQKMVTALKSR